MRILIRSIRAGCLLASAMLAGCEAPDRAPPEPAQQQQAAAPAASTKPVTSLAGEWRVAGIDGAPLDEPYGLALSGDDAGLWWEPRCAGMARTYRIDGARIAFEPPAHLEPPGGPTAPVCAIGLPPRLPDVFRALDAADTVVRTAENGVRLTGGGHSVLLFSQ